MNDTPKEKAMSSDVSKYDPDQALANRKLPPLSQMTRVQKRYFLEPWMTTGAVAFGALGSTAYVLAMFTRLHAEFAMLGVLLTIITAVFTATKLSLMEWNSHSEGALLSSNRYDYD